jgi:CRISPR/Cas system-associated endonuclease/helicase Cas3
LLHIINQYFNFTKIEIDNHFSSNIPLFLKFKHLRDFNQFEQLQILKIAQPKFELHSDDKVFIYCIYDSDKSKSGSRSSPYMIELALTR